MRQPAAKAWIDLARVESQFLFLTGDLGFKALEGLREAASSRFVNAGVAEQNMVSVAAGLARGGFKPWVYSIAPFVYARPFEQIRNDVCLHQLGVRLVGNGGGYGYGMMGSSHHAIEDYGVLSTLAGMSIFIPAFDEDLAEIVAQMNVLDGPSYLRLGFDEKPKDWKPPVYSAYRKLLEGSKGLLLVVGPLVSSYVGRLLALSPSERPECWVVSEIRQDLSNLPPSLEHAIRHSDQVVIAEEHVRRGSFGEMLALHGLERGWPARTFTVLNAMGYPSGRYGDQAFHRAESGLDWQSLSMRAGWGVE